MRMKTLTAILGALSVISIIPAAHSEIASRAYVDDKVTASQNQMVQAAFGDNETFQTVMQENGSMKGYVDDKVADSQNQIMQDVGEGLTDIVFGSSNAMATVVQENGSMKGYVDDKVAVSQLDMIQAAFGDNNNYQTVMNENGSMKGYIDDKVSAGVFAAVARNAGAANAMLVTDSDGIVSTATGGYITDDNISSTASISMGKLALPTPPNDCLATGGSCVLMYVSGVGFVWETMTRGGNESAPTNGAVTGESSTSAPQIESVSGASAPQHCGAGESWDYTTGRCERAQV